VNVPPGVTDGQRIRLSGQGEGNGDVYLVVRIQPHPRFQVIGRDVTVDLPIAPWEAVLGATVAVATPGGSARVVVPGGSSTGRRLRLRGQGMPNPRGAPGDLYAHVRITVPPAASATEKELYESLARSSSFDPRAAGR
jgi:curved DNA-binding protein